MIELSAFQQYIFDRFFDVVFIRWPDTVDYGEFGDFHTMMEDPEKYGNEDMMLEYVKDNPDLTLEEISQYWGDHTEFPSDPDWVWDLSDEEFEAMFPERFEDDDDEDGMTFREIVQMIYDRYKVYKKN